MWLAQIIDNFLKGKLFHEYKENSSTKVGKIQKPGEPTTRKVNSEEKRFRERRQE